MKEHSVKSSIRISSLALLALAVACGAGSEQADPGTTAAAVTTTSTVPIGMLLGGGMFDNGVTQGMTDYAATGVSELRNGLGVQWVRIEAGWSNHDTWATVAKTIELAHRSGVKVILVRSTGDNPCLNDQDPNAINAFIDGYLSDLT